MRRTCKICRSPNIDKINQMFLVDRFTIKDIHKIATEQFNESASYNTFQRHFQYDVIKFREASVAADRLKTQKIEEDIKRELEVSRTFRTYLFDIVDEVKKMKQEVQADVTVRRMLLDYIKVGIDTIDKLLRWGEQLGLATKEYSVDDKIAWCLQDIPPEYIKTFKDRWEEYDERS